MFCFSRVSKLLSLILVLSASIVALTLSVSAQENATGQQATTSITILDSNRERDGLLGPVRRVRTETAKLSLISGKPVEGARALLETTTYDLQGNRVENAYYPVLANSPTGQEKYKYDDKGNVIEMTLQDSLGSVMSMEVYHYEFDPVGNWIKMVTSLVVYEGGRKSYEPTEVTYRTISYYFDEALARMDKPASSPVAAQSGAAVSNNTDSARAVATVSRSEASDLRPEMEAKKIPSLLSAAIMPDEHIGMPTYTDIGGLPAPATLTNQSHTPVIKVDEPPDHPMPNPQARLIPNVILNSRPLSVPKPDYPEAAKRAGVTGAVVVEVKIDMEGKVVVARALSGPELLRTPAVEAALRARFSPALFSGQPTKSSGVITFRFSYSR